MPMISAVSWSAGPTSAPVIPKTYHNPGTAPDEGSSYFDGTDDYLKVASNTSFRLGTGDFTIECWVYFPFSSLQGGSNRRIFCLDDGGNFADNLQILVDNGGVNRAGNLFLYSNSILGSLDTDIRFGWHHIAVVRNSGTLDFYLDGVSKSSVSNTQDYSPGPSAPAPMIGATGAGTGDYQGNISNFRMVVGTAVYTNNFIVPTAPLTDITNTQLLTCQNNNGAITDASSNSHGITAFGNVQASSSNPFPDGGRSNVWSGDRGLYSGGSTNGDVMQYIDITSLGNAVDFGDLLQSTNGRASASNGTRAVISGGVTTPPKDKIEYVTISTPGNSQAFGNLNIHRYAHASFSDGTYGVMSNGIGGVSNTNLNHIEYVTIATTGNGTDFGDGTESRKAVSGAANSTHGLTAGGNSSDTGGFTVTIDYITIATPGNATDFGDMDDGREYFGMTGSATRVLFGGGDT